MAALTTGTRVVLSSYRFLDSAAGVIPLDRTA
jgi:hypothetical protein